MNCDLCNHATEPMIREHIFKDRDGWDWFRLISTCPCCQRIQTDYEGIEDVAFTEAVRERRRKHQSGFSTVPPKRRALKDSPHYYRMMARRNLARLRKGES